MVNKIKTIVLDNKKLYENRVEWLLVKVNLLDYLKSLRDDFYDYDVQRRIEQNPYMDKLIETIQNEEPIPAFSIVCNNSSVQADSLVLNECEIIDGLQRTFRLWAYFYLWNIIKKDPNADYKLVHSKLNESPEGQKILETKVLNRRKIYNLLQVTDNGETQINNIIKKIQDYTILLNVWSGLKSEEIVKKMLTLNAGHKSVSNIHQFEILFLRCYKELDLPAEIQLIRERDPLYAKVKRGHGERGQYLMSSVTIALQSYIQGKPLRIAQVNNITFEDADLPIDSGKFFSKEILRDYIDLLWNMDCKFSTDTQIRNWFFKDTTLSGLFAALGRKTENSMDFTSHGATYKLINQITIDNLNISKFHEAYNTLSSMSSNVGNSLRKAVFRYFQAMFENKEKEWSDCFEFKGYEEE